MTPSQPAIVLRRGDSGAAVADVCDRLRLTGDLTEISAGDGADLTTGDTGPDTSFGEHRHVAVYDERVEQAVKSFQQRRGLLVDGVVGPATYAVLDGARWALGDRVLSHIPGRFLEGDDVASLQRRLVELGFHRGKVDGIFGPETERAVRAFQAGVGLVDDGTVGPETMRAFFALRRSVSGGSATALREREHIRRSGHSLAGRTIVIDPGHGGRDPGVHGSHGLVEADLVLDIARRIEGRLSAHGVNVVFTRTESTDGGSEDERAAFANTFGADLVISLHCDHSAHPAARGVAAFFYGAHTHGGWSTIGEHFSDLVLREVVARTGLLDCRAHARTWPLLRRTRMPAVRLDIGYLSHPEDAALLASPATLDRIAEGVVVAMQRTYLGEADTAQTGVLGLDDLRRHLDAMRAAHTSG